MTVEQVLATLVKIRKGKWITQKELSDKLGLASGELSLIEHGKVGLSMRRFLEICDVLEVLPQDVLIERKYPDREQILMDISQKLLPEEMEMLVDLATKMYRARTVF